MVCFLSSKDFPAFVRVCYQPETADVYVKRCALAIFQVTTTASLRRAILCRRACVRTFRNIVVPSSVNVDGLGGIGRRGPLTQHYSVMSEKTRILTLVYDTSEFRTNVL